MELQGASMDTVMQFTLASDCKKHYHWQCNCGLHNLAGHSSSSSSSNSPAKVVSANKKKNMNMNAGSDGPLSMKSRRSRRLMDLSCGGIKDKKQSSIGNLLELLDSTRSLEEIRRDAAKQEPL